MSKEYFKKYKDPRWQKLRLQILEREGFKCQACGRSNETLHIHHLWYEFDKEPWEANPRLLECLCVTCHAARKDIDLAEIYHVRTRPTSQIVDEGCREDFLESGNG